jgi:hypothetical protein
VVEGYREVAVVGVVWWAEVVHSLGEAEGLGEDHSPAVVVVLVVEEVPQRSPLQHLGIPADRSPLVHLAGYHLCNSENIVHILIYSVKYSFQ